MQLKIIKESRTKRYMTSFYIAASISFLAGLIVLLLPEKIVKSYIIWSNSLSGVKSKITEHSISFFRLKSLIFFGFALLFAMAA